MTDIDYADNLALLENTPAQSKSLLHSQAQAAGGISLYVNANKTEFKQKEAIFMLSGKPLKLMDQFTYFSSNISSLKVMSTYT